MSYSSDLPNSDTGDPKAGSDTGHPRRSSKMPLVATGAAVAALLAGTGVFLGVKLTSSGAQPDTVLPGNTIAYARIDLDPSAGQKIGAFRLVDKLPAMKDSLSKGNPKKAFFEQLKKTDSLRDLDYDRDIAPWLGDRFALAVVPNKDGSKAFPVTAVAVTDEAKARETVDRIAKRAREKAKEVDRSTSGLSPVDATQETTHVLRDGFLLTMPAPEKDSIVAAIESGSLAKKQNHVDDMKALGDPGVASAWFDPKPFKQLLPPEFDRGGKTSSNLDSINSTAVAVRVSADHLEIASTAKAPDGKTLPPALKDVTTLPGETAVLFSTSGISENLAKVWQPMLDSASVTMPTLPQSITDAEKRLGISLPGDLQTVLGRQAEMVLAASAFDGNQSGLGLRTAPDLAKAEDVLSRINASGQTRIAHESKDGYLILGTPDQRKALTEKGNLGERPSFTKAMSRLDTANSALYLDLDKFEDRYLSKVPDDSRELVRAMSAVGWTSGTADGRQVSTLRLVVN